MSDEYVLRDDNGITVLDGNRTDKKRRIKIDRREKVPNDTYPIISANGREISERRQSVDRRTGHCASGIDWFFDKAGSILIGLFLLFLGVIFAIKGVTFFPVAGVGIALLIALLGAILILKPART